MRFKNRMNKIKVYFSLDIWPIIVRKLKMIEKNVK